MEVKLVLMDGWLCMFDVSVGIPVSQHIYRGQRTTVSVVLTFYLV